MSTPAVLPDDFGSEELSLEQLRELAMQATGNGEPTAPTPAPRQAKPAVQPQADPVEEEETDILIRREIDLGDGSGKQVFEGVGATKEEALEDLNEKLLNAQTHATRKIQELTRKPAAKTVETLSPEQEIALSQTLLTEPSKVVKQIIEREFGMPIEQVKERLNDAQVARQKNEANEQEQIGHNTAVEFCQAHPEFYMCDTNGNRMIRWLELEGIAQPTVADMERAFESLSTDGLLVQKPGPQAQPRNGEGERIAQPQVTRRAASSLSVRRQVAPPARRATELTEEEVDQIPTERLRELAERAIRSR